MTISHTTALLVSLFFYHGAIASIIVGIAFFKKNDRTLKFFGLALLFNGVAFMTWAILVANHLNNLRIIAGIAALFLLLAMYSFMVSALQKVKDVSLYLTVLVIGSLATLGLFVMRSFVYPTHIAITNNGFLLFDMRSQMQIAYILVLCATVLPAANAVAGKFHKSSLGALIRACFTALTIGAVILIVSSDADLILADGIFMSAAFIMLWVAVLAGARKALDKVS